VFTGVAASAGIAVGLAYRTDRMRTVVSSRRTGSAAAQIDGAFDAVAARMRELAYALRGEGKREQADIMEVACTIAEDPELRGAALRHAKSDPVPVAVGRAVDEYANLLADLPDPELAERATDVRQVGRRALAWLNADSADHVEGPLVLLAHEIGAADLLEPHAPVVAAASVIGGPNSHAAIVARSLGIPLLLGLDQSALSCPDGTEVVVDAEQARVTLRPEPAERRAALNAMDAARARRAALAAERDLPSRTTDGHTMVVRANIATPGDARNALIAGADGVGLLRTELPFLDAAAWPTFDRHLATLEPIFRELPGQPVTARTLDYADDKLPPFLSPDGRRIGRGLPLMLAQPEAFADQFRALLAAGAGSDLRIMIPMVSTVDELAACRRLLAEAADRAGAELPPLGAMIELPEAVAAIDAIAAECAFLSIGSNDLTCQILSLDRRDPLAAPAMTAHPHVLQAIGDVVTAAHNRGIQVSVCGDAGAHPDVIPLLIGLGVDILSVAPAALDEVRARIRRLDRGVCSALAADALKCTTATEVRTLVQRHCPPS
jgi:phosphoenolpyruvate-protein kinase (PTS system EI component)